MKSQKINVTRVLCLMVLFVALLAGNLFVPAQVAEAAAKSPSLSAKEMTIPMGKMSGKVSWDTSLYETSFAKKLSVSNKVSGATYSFTSSDAKVVTISKDGGYLTGLKAGSATITCKQTLKGKTTTIGKCKVTVKKAIFKADQKEFSVGSGEYSIQSFVNYDDKAFYILYRNPSATYTWTTDSKNFTIKDIKIDAAYIDSLDIADEWKGLYKEPLGDGCIYGYEYTAKKAGTYTVTVKETYNKKTVTVATFKVTVKK
ncbi:MAG: hypothetical protein QM644_10715 [Mobilitalea sp.]